MKCQYCGKELQKGLMMHERYCKNKPVVTVESMKDTGIISKSEKLKEIPKESFWEYYKRESIFMKLFLKKQKQEPKETSIEDVLKSMPKWSIKEGKPWFVGENKKRKLIQFVGVSRLKPSVTAWVFWDGIFVSNPEGDRLYKPPHDIHGNQFFYDLDRSVPLLDNVKDDEETHESLRMAQVKNIAYAMGRIAGAQDLLKNLGLILLGIGFIVLLSIANIYFSYQVVQGFGAANSQIGNITTAVQNYMVTHP